MKKLNDELERLLESIADVYHFTAKQKEVARELMRTAFLAGRAERSEEVVRAQRERL